jgi:pimeloyl-ACP methyl ester carboxylesterase
MIKHDYADVNGVRLHYASAGNGKLILFVHGFPEFWYAWRRQLREFGRDHLAVAPDTRGYNLSSKPEGTDPYRIKHLVADLRALASHLGHQKFVLVAHDWGAATAWAFAIAHPESIDKLVIINGPHPGIFLHNLANHRGQQEASQYMRFFQEVDAGEKLSRDDFAMLEKFALGLGSAQNPFNDEDRKIYREAWSQPGALEAALNYYRASRAVPPLPGGHMENASFDPEALKVKVPTLVIWGERDTALLPCNLDGLESYVPDLTLRRVPDASHWIVHERPDEVNQYIREFVAGR